MENLRARFAKASEGLAKRGLAVLALAMAQIAFAEPHIVTIPGQGWHLVVDAPALTSSEGSAGGGRFSYTGADVNSGITFSIHTEEMKQGSNKSCRDVYWAKTQNNPYIVTGSPVFFETATLVGVTYRSEGEYRGRAFTTANSHGYFVKSGKCVDLHVSQIPYSDEGRARVEHMVRTARVMD